MERDPFRRGLGFPPEPAAARIARLTRLPTRSVEWILQKDKPPAAIEINSKTGIVHPQPTGSVEKQERLAT